MLIWCALGGFPSICGGSSSRIRSCASICAVLFTVVVFRRFCFIVTLCHCLPFPSLAKVRFQVRFAILVLSSKHILLLAGSFQRDLVRGCVSSGELLFLFDLGMSFMHVPLLRRTERTQFGWLGRCSGQQEHGVLILCWRHRRVSHYFLCRMNLHSMLCRSICSKLIFRCLFECLLYVAGARGR